MNQRTRRVPGLAVPYSLDPGFWNSCCPTLVTSEKPALTPWIVGGPLPPSPQQAPSKSVS